MDEYHEIINAKKLNQQIVIEEKNLQELYEDARIVITEDSTVGLEAMFYGKILIHAHFAKSLPVIPFVEYKSALAAMNSKMLNEMLTLANNLNNDALMEMQTGQRNFIIDFSGPCDGKNMERLEEFISKIL